MRVGTISAIAGLIGATVAYFREAQHRRFQTIWGQLAFYASKYSAACAAAYLSLLVLPIWNMGTSVETEQAIAILAAILGGDFIGLLIRKVFGTLPASSPWTGETRSGQGNSSGNP